MIADNAWIDAAVRLLVIIALITVTALTLIYAERKFLGRIQMRLGPMRVGPYGMLQSAADAIKLLTKEDLRPHTADRWVFELAPFAVLAPTFIALVSLPFTEDLWVRNLELGLFYVVAFAGLSIVGLLMAGWGSDNRYALLGAVRAAAQLISYELPLVLAVLGVAMLAGTLNLVEIVEQQGRVPFIAWQPLGFLLFMIAVVAELYRNPFDIPVGESEVVGGPFIEYSGMRWAIFFLAAEYVNLWAFPLLASLVFLGGWNWPLGNEVGWPLQVVWTVGKTTVLILFLMWLRATMPRLRIDQLMAFCWQVLLPVAFLGIVLNGLVLVYEWPDVVLGILSGLATLPILVGIYAGGLRGRPMSFARILAQVGGGSR